MANGFSATTPPKKPKSRQYEFADARRACRTPEAHAQLALIIDARWTEAELREYARLFHFRNGKDYPTVASYQRAIADLGNHYRGLAYPGAKPSDYPHNWLSYFREGGSKITPPRREGLLQRGRGLRSRVSDEEYAWPGHTEEFRSMIEQRARDYFKISSEQPLHVNAWAASQRAYWRERWATAEAQRKEREAVEFHLVPKSQKSSLKSRGLKLVPQHDDTFWGQTLKPHFNIEFPGHSEAFREEVAALARRGKKPDAHVSPMSWKIACHKQYVLVEGNAQRR
jgi:hypothetical protein